MNLVKTNLVCNKVLKYILRIFKWVPFLSEHEPMVTKENEVTGS